jgi:transcriptional repressor NF-X1
MALALDPEREAQVYSEDTVVAYQRDPKWAQGIEQKMRSFCEALEQKRLQFAPMKAGMRTFVHALAEDWGLQSESQDPEPYRSVVVRKPVTFVAAARKTIAEVIAGGAPSTAAASTGSAATGSATPSLTQLKRPPRGPAVNAFYLRHIAVGTLSSDLERELAPVLKESQLRFEITWHGDEDVLLKPKTGSMGPEQVEAELNGLSMKLKRLVASKGLADSAETVWVGMDGKVKDNAAPATGSGWSTVATQRRPVLVNKPGVASSNGFAVFAAGGAAVEKVQEKKKKEVKEVVDDWEMEADEEEEKEAKSADEEGKDEEVGEASEGLGEVKSDDGEAFEDGQEEVNVQDKDKGKGKEVVGDEAAATPEEIQENQDTTVEEFVGEKEEVKEEAKV